MPLHGFINEIYLGSNHIQSDVPEHYSISHFPIKPWKPRSKFGAWFHGVGPRFNGDGFVLD